VCRERVDLLQRVVEVASEADGSVIHEHMRGRFPIRDFADHVFERVVAQPSPDVVTAMPLAESSVNDRALA